MLQNIGLLEIVVISAVVLLLFGASRLPKFAKGASEAKDEFNKGLNGDDSSKKSKNSKK